MKTINTNLSLTELNDLCYSMYNEILATRGQYVRYDKIEKKQNELKRLILFYNRLVEKGKNFPKFNYKTLSLY